MAETIKGGIATYLDGLWSSQAARYGRDGIHFLVPEDEADGLPSVPPEYVRPLPKRDRRLGGAIRTMAAIRRECRDLRPNLVHVHSSFAGLYLRLLRLLGAVPAPLVYCAHGWSFQRQATWLQTSLFRFAERVLATQCEAIVCISKSEYMAARRAGVPRHKCFVVYNGVPAPIVSDGDDREPGGGTGELQLLYVGRFDRQKGIDVLIGAMRALQGSPAHLSIVGSFVLNDGVLPSELPSNVTLLGWRSAAERDALIRQSDAVVVPSRWEGFGLVAAEAMRMGKPVIGSRVGGLAELVENDVTGRLVPPGNAAALAAALNALPAEDLQRWGRLGQARVTALFDCEALANRLAAIYNSATGWHEPIINILLPRTDA